MVRKIPVRINFERVRNFDFSKSLLKHYPLLNACNKLTCEHGGVRIDRNRVDTCPHQELCERRV
ncbi:MAG: hypothetical protein QXU11_12095, partial [Thermoproteota archaeon]